MHCNFLKCEMLFIGGLMGVYIWYIEAKNQLYI
jgi:hypothetical protein